MGIRNIFFDPLPLESREFNRVAVITPADLQEPLINTTQTVQIQIPANSRLRDLLVDLTTPFRSPDATFDDVQVSVNDDVGSLWVSNLQVRDGNASLRRLAQGDRMINTTFASTDGTAAAASANLGNLAAETERIGDDLRALRGTPGVGRLYHLPALLRVVFTPKTGKALSALNVGELRLYAVLHVSGFSG